MSFKIQGIDHHHHHHNLHPQNQGDDDHDHEGSSSIGGGSKSYDCVFCQRGFTTAQALGGHMNIHRKDRSLSTPKLPISPNPPTNYKLPTTISSKQVGLEEEEEDYNIDDHQVNYAPNTRLFSSSPPKGYFGFPHSLDGPLRFGGQSNWFGSGSQGDHLSSGKRVRNHHHGQEEEELDLELRLGHYPW